jgi:hypothetical protein
MPVYVLTHCITEESPKIPKSVVLSPISVVGTFGCEKQVESLEQASILVTDTRCKVGIVEYILKSRL